MATIMGYTARTLFLKHTRSSFGSPVTCQRIDKRGEKGLEMKNIVFSCFVEEMYKQEGDGSGGAPSMHPKGRGVVY